MTSLNAPGFSASLLNVSAIDRALASKDVTINSYDLLDAPTEAHSWLGVRKYWDRLSKLEDTKDYFLQELTHHEVSTSSLDLPTPTTIGSALQSACEAVRKVEKELTEYDTIAGDGDCGHTFAAGAEGKYVSTRLENKF